MKRTFRILLSGCFALIAGQMIALGGHLSQTDVPRRGFLENQGQWPDDALYQISASGFALKFQRNGILFMSGRELDSDRSDSDRSDSDRSDSDRSDSDRSDSDRSDSDRMEAESEYVEEDGIDLQMGDQRKEEEYEYYVWKMSFAGGKVNPEVVAKDVVAARTNYFLGNDSTKWRRNVPEYREITYMEVWEGIDIRFRLGPNGELKYDFLLSPGADPYLIRMDFAGIDSLTILEDGRLEIGHPWKPVYEEAPLAYLSSNGHPVPLRYQKAGPFSYHFEIQESVPPGEAWVIDPFMQVWSSYTNTTSLLSPNYAYDVSHDQAGNLIICGAADTFFPATPGAFQTTYGGGWRDGYVAKFSPDGSNLVYMTYLGGSDDDLAFSVAATANGEVFTGGKTLSPNFPITPGSYAPTNPNYTKPFLVKLNAAGNNLSYSTFACDSCSGSVEALALVSNGELIASGTDLNNTPFTPSPGAFMTTHPGLIGVWLARFNATGSNMVWGTLFGSTGADYVYDIDVNDLEEPYIVGSAFGFNLPITPGTFQGAGVQAAYVARFNANGTGLVFCSNYGNYGSLRGVAVHPLTRDAYVCGLFQANLNPSTPGAFQTANAGANDAVVARISADGSTLIYSTYFGGSFSDGAYGIDVNSKGEAYVTGRTLSYNLPISPCQLQLIKGLNWDFFIVHLSPMGDSLMAGGSAFFGGNDADYEYPKVELREDGYRDTLFCCLTSHSLNFPTTPGSFQPTKLNGNADCPAAMKLVAVAPGPNVIPDKTLCVQDSAELNAPAQATNLLWSNNATTSSIWINQSGKYWVQGLINGCAFSDTFNITLALLAINLGPDSTICDPGAFSIPLTAGAGTSWLWSNAATSTTITVNQPGTYWVEVQDSVTGCEAKDSIVILQSPRPIINLPSPQQICSGDSILLDADSSGQYPGASYLWSNGAVTQTSTFDTAGWAWVSLTSSVGCTTRDSSLIVVNPLPLVNIGPDTSLCDNETLTRNAGQGFVAYLWSNNDTTPTSDFMQSGTVWVQVTDSNGCLNKDTALVTFNPLPTINLGPDTTLCDTNVLYANAGPGFSTYLWSNNATTQTTNFTQSGLIWVEVTDANGCSNRDSMLLNRGALPQPDLGLDTTLCEGNSLTLIPLGNGIGYSFVWSNNATAAGITVNQSGMYSVIATDLSSGCIGEDSILISVVPGPVPVLSTDTLVCDAGVFELNPGSFTAYNWSEGSSTAILSVNEGGIYSVTVSDGNGCEGNTQALVRFGTTPKPNLGPDLELCEEDRYSLSIPRVPGNLIHWSDGGAGNSMIVNESGIYWVEISNECGRGTDTIAVVFLGEKNGPFLPNVFRPGSEFPENTIFRAMGDQPQDFQLTLYDRWGALIFQTRTIQDGWDGMIDGQNAQEGVYVFVMQLRACDGKLVTRKGTVVLLR